MCYVGRTKAEHHTAGVDLLKKIRFLLSYPAIESAVD